MRSTIDDFGTISLTAKGVSQQGVVDNGPAIYKSALLENIDGASAAWGAKLIWLLLAIVCAVGALFMIVSATNTDHDDQSTMLTMAVMGGLVAYIFYVLYQRSKMCVLSVFAGQLTITDRVNAVGLDPALDFIGALERAQEARGSVDP